jgi:HSP20 family protein
MNNSPITDVMQSARTILRRVLDDGRDGAGGPTNGVDTHEHPQPVSFSLASVLGLRIKPRVDVWESDGAFTVLVDLPGVRRDSIRVIASSDAVAISGECRQDPPRDARIRREERRVGYFQRVIPLGQGARPENASVRLDAGVLEIRVPKGPGAKGEPVKIQLSTPS